MFISLSQLAYIPVLSSNLVHNKGQNLLCHAGQLYWHKGIISRFFSCNDVICFQNLIDFKICRAKEVYNTRSPHGYTYRVVTVSVGVVKDD